ncbi:MAG TPA: hypothetical protein PK044_00545 [Exilispira sp.]|nr:hypothetical protein [Exilispira sp.]
MKKKLLFYICMVVLFLITQEITIKTDNKDSSVIFGFNNKIYQYQLLNNTLNQVFSGDFFILDFVSYNDQFFFVAQSNDEKVLYQFKEKKILKLKNFGKNNVYISNKYVLSIDYTKFSPDFNGYLFNIYEITGKSKISLKHKGKFYLNIIINDTETIGDTIYFTGENSSSINLYAFKYSVDDKSLHKIFETKKNKNFLKICNIDEKIMLFSSSNDFNASMVNDDKLIKNTSKVQVKDLLFYNTKTSSLNKIDIKFNIRFDFNFYGVAFYLDDYIYIQVIDKYYKTYLCKLSYKEDSVYFIELFDLIDINSNQNITGLNEDSSVSKNSNNKKIPDDLTIYKIINKNSDQAGSQLKQILPYISYNYFKREFGFKFVVLDIGAMKVIFNLTL